MSSMTEEAIPNDNGTTYFEYIMYINILNFELLIITIRNLI